MKKYIQPADRIIALEAEGTIAGSDFKISDAEADIDALTQKKDEDLWGNESVWK